MSMFVGNTFVKTEDVRGTYRNIDKYDTNEDENKNIGDVILEEDYINRIDQIYYDLINTIKTFENYDMVSGIDELKILAERLY